MTWTPPVTLEERLKTALVPPQLYIRYLYRKELRRGEPEIRLVPWLADRRRVSLDVGANRGVYTYALLPHSRAVHAFEPNPKMFDALRHWARGRAELHPIALGDAAGTAELRVPRRRHGFSNQGASLSPAKADRPHAALSVETARLDDLGIEDVGFIKIDVEGFETEVLVGARETLRRDRPNLLVELEEKHTAAPLGELVSGICGYGYRCFALRYGTLTAFERLDLEAHHRAPATRRDYIFNFIFLPA